MSRDVEIYTAVLHRVAAVDHGWGKPYTFQALYVLDRAVPAIEEPGTDPDGPTPPGYAFATALRSALRATSPDLPALTFVRSVQEVYDAERRGPIQVRDGGAFIALGPIYGDTQRAIVGVMFYGGHRWARWMRYYLERADDVWYIASREELAVS